MYVKRYKEKFVINNTWTERYLRSALPYMKKLLNEEDHNKQEICKQISNFKPVNNGR